MTLPEADARWETSMRELGKALARLKDVLHEPPDNPLLLDATIQRFEFTIELYWKTLRHLLAREGYSVSSPREAMQRAYQMDWLQDEAAWLQMLKDRNQTSHTYHEELARTIFEHITDNFAEMEQTYHFLKNKFLP